MYFLSGNTEYGHLFHDHNLQIYSGKNELPQHQLRNPSPERAHKFSVGHRDYLKANTFRLFQVAHRDPRQELGTHSVLLAI